MLLFGAWGKTGINCFVIITCWFLCKSKITGHKLLKLYLQILFYAVIIFAIFLITGHETLSVKGIIYRIFPISSISTDFVSCFLIFYLLIPFLNILINNLDKKKHLFLSILLLSVFTFLPSIPKFYFTFNYVSWFSVLYIMTSYIRFYGIGIDISHKQWGWISLGLLLLGSFSVYAMLMIYKYNYYNQFSVYHFLTDSNKLLPLILAFSSFMWFKDLKIPHSRLINAVGASTFGVLLIHANSDAMRQWLWREIVGCVDHFSGDVILTLGYALVSVLIIFTVCSGIDWFRGRIIEPKLIKTTTTVFNRYLKFKRDNKIVNANT